MNKPLTITDALTGKAKPVKQLRWMFVCPSCGRDNGQTNRPPLRTQCISFGCYAEIEAEENPDYVRPSMLTLQVPEAAE